MVYGFYLRCYTVVKAGNDIGNSLGLDFYLTSFLGSAFISIPIHHWIYPQNELNTFVTDLSDATIIVTHPSGNAQVQLTPQAAEGIGAATTRIY